MDGDLLFDVPVHPAAECFRLMHDDELQSLAADIAEHGLRDAITIGCINGEEVGIVDGRNRYRACGLAGVEPHFVTIDFADDDEVRAFVASRSERRDVTKGERAMAIAMLYPEPGRGRGNIDAARKETGSVSFTRIKEARQVLRYSREVADAVRDGVTKLDDALAGVRQAQADLESDDTKLRLLRSNAPDLASLVDEERLTLGEAYQTHEQRVAEAARVEQAKRDTLLRLTEAAFRGASAWAVTDFADAVRERIDDPEFRDALIERLRLAPDANRRALVDGVNALCKTLRGVISS